MSLLIPIVFSLVTTRAVAVADVSVMTPSPYYEAPNVGHSFPVNVDITGVTGLFAYEIKLYYNTTLLDATTVTLPTNHFLKPVDPSKIFEVKREALDSFNATHGRVWVGLTLLAPEAAKTGGGTLFTINFVSRAMGGPDPLTLSAPHANTTKYPESEYPVKLSDTTATPIPCTVKHGSVKVIPEFPLVLLVPLFIVVTLISVILGKTAWLKKRISSLPPTRA